VQALRQRGGELIEYLSNPYNLTFSVYLILCQLVLICVMRRQAVSWIIPIVLLTDSLLVSLFVLEIVLSTGVFDDDRRWVPRRFLEADQRLSESQARHAHKNPLGFNDDVFNVEKPTGVRRIAVVGDSFIFGNGLPYDEIWGVKLRRLISVKYPRTETLFWGKNGWSTLAQLDFLQSTGVKFKPDLLIFGFVTNDPSPCYFDCVNRFTWHHSRKWTPIKDLFPEAFNFLSSFLNRFVETVSSLGHENWVNRLYSEENLNRYAQTLLEVAHFANRADIPVVFVLTPSDHGADSERKFEAVKPLMARAGLPVLDLLPAVRNQLGHLPPEKLRASRANGHPGPLMTSLFAKEVFAYLQRENLL
jgi:hypothetical protein